MRRRKKLWFSAAAAASALICAELVLRAVGFAAPAWYRPDPALGWALRPELRDVNTSGQRDREHTLAKPPGVYRIALLGDEYSEARQLPLADTWWAQLGEKLERCAFQPQKRIEVLNFAVGGYGSAQQYVQLETSVMRHQPDLVLLQFNNADDVRNNSFILEPQKQRPFFMLQANGSLVIDDSFNASPGFRRSSSLKYEAWRRLGDRWRVVQLASALADLDLVSSAYAGPDASTALPQDATWEEAWRVTEALIERSRDFAGRNGARFALVIVPAKRQLLAANDSYAEKRLQAFAARRSIRAIALEGEMQRRGSVEALFDAKEGHQAAAEIIAQRLCENSGSGS